MKLIKNAEIFSIINEVSYVLALSNEPQQLIEMVLDRLLHLLSIDYGWLQLIDSEDHSLRLVASCGIAPEMKRMSGLARSQQDLGEQVVTGLKVIIKDLSRDGKYGLSPFGRAGFRSLVAVPISTYHTHGVIGVASRAKKQFNAETADLLMTIAGLVGATLNVAELGKIELLRERQQITEECPGEKTALADMDCDPMTVAAPPAEEGGAEGLASGGNPATTGKEENTDDSGAFGDHARRMSAFRRSHE